MPQLLGQSHKTLGLIRFAALYSPDFSCRLDVTDSISKFGRDKLGREYEKNDIEGELVRYSLPQEMPNLNDP